MCVCTMHMSGEVDSFNTPCLAMIAVATRQILWKSVNIFQSYSKDIWLTFFGNIVICE